MEKVTKKTKAVAKKTAKKTTKASTTVEAPKELIQDSKPVVSKTVEKPVTNEALVDNGTVTIRDYIVGQALIALQHQRFPTYADRAKAAYELADEIIKLR
jgi:capsid protein